MKTALEQRIGNLKEQLDNGRQRLAALESETASVREDLLRIEGAIQVLEELAAEGDPAAR